MPLYDLLSAQRVAILDRTGDRDAVLDRAAYLLADGHASAALALRTSLGERERLASTAIGHGVAIPHARTALVETSRAAFLRLDAPVDFAAADGQPVDLVLAMAIPEHHVQQHLLLLAELAERFADAGFRERLRRAAGQAELAGCLLDYCRRSAA
ncbi:PTS sugar transporter subunit IIA [Lysobacter firmicutimachus]|uniref:PTS sugar transporter subunit IIA n=1 Tax=Lysobacter firmicutimachus TaxID=1792846 RepID=A0AAU8MRT5_9GAMM|nr:PTS sugar transporter subunit IIA [Lysobacter antibioticus]